MSSEEIGKHKGAVETLLHEKKELSRLLNIVNSQLKRRLKALEEQGVDTDEILEKFQGAQQNPKRDTTNKSSGGKELKNSDERSGSSHNREADKSGKISNQKRTDRKSGDSTRSIKDRNERAKTRERDESELSEDMLEGRPDLEEKTRDKSEEDSDSDERDFNPLN